MLFKLERKGPYYWITPSETSLEGAFDLIISQWQCGEVCKKDLCHWFHLLNVCHFIPCISENVKLSVCPLHIFKDHTNLLMQP